MPSSASNARRASRRSGARARSVSRRRACSRSASARSAARSRSRSSAAAWAGSCSSTATSSSSRTSPPGALRRAARARTRTQGRRCAGTLARIGGPTRLETHAEHLDADNLAELARGVDLVLDGTDNLSTRYLLNDFAVERGVPWVYGGVVSAHGLVMAVVPGRGPCLRCLFPEMAPPGTLATCDTAGVLQPAVAAIAALQAGLALRLLAAPEGFEPRLLEVDAWDGDVRALGVERDPACPCCARREFPFLHAPATQRAVSLCGRNTVQVRGTRTKPDLEALERALHGIARALRRDGALLRFEIDGHKVTLFADGRALIEGTDDLGRALALYDRYVGT
ncbi:MAG: ThiF family adenylyltransferase [Planctomycetes bacterium]|nr:ThiF family adenylyltransferase [Planctomycetota bacterium]